MCTVHVYLVRIHRKQYHYLIINSLLCIGQGIKNTTVLSLLYECIDPLHGLTASIVNKTHVIS
jgi:hypothetical protein